MPYLNMALSGELRAEQEAAIAEILTDLTEAHLGKERALTAVAIASFDNHQWFIGARPMENGGLRGFCLRVAVTAGTNTKAQIANYIDAVFVEMDKILGGVRKESYVIVDEIPAPNWGYGGRSQEYRFIMG